MAPRKCQTCHGNKTITVWDPVARTYKTIKCTACDGRGWFDPSTV